MSDPRPPWERAYDASGGDDPSDAAAERDLDRRPTTVTAAGITTVVCSGLAAVGFLVVGVLSLVQRDSVVSTIERSMSAEQRAGMSSEEIRALAGVVLTVGIGVLLAWSLVALALGVLTLRGSGAARAGLMASAILSAVVSVLTLATGISAVTLVASLAVLVLLGTGGAGEWFARRGRQRRRPRSRSEG